MNKEESLALYEKGKDAWNAWANDMLAKKAELEKAGQWEIKGQAARDWMNDSMVNFYQHIFKDEVNFSGFIFPYSVNFREVIFDNKAMFESIKFNGTVWFSDATFSNSVWFDNTIFSNEAMFNGAIFDDYAEFISTIFCNVARFSGTRFRNNAMFSESAFRGRVEFNNTTFYGEAWFDNMIFSYDAEFSLAKFSSGAWFNDTTFSGDAWFCEATFNGDVSFSHALFEDSATFDEAIFERNSFFIAAEGQNSFSFWYAKFYVAPNFNQAHFKEAPQFDVADFSKALKHSYSESKENVSSRWRSLKRLAIQGHDHERELMFFAEEIKSQRGIQDKALPHPIDYINNNNNDVFWPGGARYWFGCLYQVLSDFGRSVMRPIFWMLFFGILFQVLYLNYPIDSEPQETISCDRSEAATYLSVRSALPFLPATSYSENLNRSYTCLYGKNSDGKENIPNAIVFLSIFQTILSSILIFLLLLALRNHFRIK